MPKLTLTDIANISGAESTAIANINANSAAIETALENTLSRDGTSPNQMNADLDMNDFEILNVATPTSATSAVNRQYVEDYFGDAEAVVVTPGANTVDDSHVKSSANILASKIRFTNSGSGASHRLLSTKLQESFVSVKDFGAVGDGVTDDTTAINNAVAFVNSLGGGTVYFPQGTYATSTGIVLGNGSNSAPSTKDNKVRLVGENFGSSTGIINQQVNGASRILYTGSTSSTAAVLSLQGPMYGVGVEYLALDCDSKAGIGLLVNHVTMATLQNVCARNYTAIGYDFTTRTGFPAGCAFGCADNRMYDCYGYLDSTPSGDVLGIRLSSGVNTASSLVGQPDTARLVILGGTFMYGQTADSHGIWLSGADNNYIAEVQLYPYAGTTLGYDVYLNQWAGSGNFPLENFFSNLGMTRGVSGNGGVGSSWGNTFFPFPTSDGAGFPALSGLSGGDHTGKSYIAGARAYCQKSITKAESQTPRSTTSSSYSNVTGYTIAVTTLASTKLKITFSGSATKAVTGSGYFVIALNGSALGTTECPTNATGFYSQISTSTVVDVGAGPQSISVQFKSDGTNATTLDRGILIVEELY